MTESIKTLVNALRHELQQYGEMLAFLERQQQQIAARSADEVYQSISPIKLKGQDIQKARADRDECRAQVARSLNLPGETPFAQLIPALPADCQPLLKALVEENNELLVRVRQRTRQNHLRLARSIELMQGLINSLSPSHDARIYNGRGNKKVRRTVQRPIYEAVG